MSHKRPIALPLEGITTTVTDGTQKVDDDEARIRLATEYRRIHDKVLGPYSEIVGEKGVAILTAKLRIAPDDPRYPLVMSRALPSFLRIRMIGWKADPPTEAEQRVYRTLSEFNPTLHGLPTIETLIARLVLRDLRYAPLEARIPVDDPGLAAAWNDTAPIGSRRIPLMQRAGPDWLRETTVEPTPNPAPKPRIVH